MKKEAISFFKTFPDQHLVNNPYKIMLAQGEWTCTVADYSGTRNYEGADDDARWKHHFADE